MERDVEMAIHQALSLSRARGGQLAALTLRGHDHTGDIVDVARQILRRLGRQADVHFEPAGGPIELASIEVTPAPR